MRLTRTLALLGAASIGLAGIAAASATGAAEPATGARDIVLVVDSTGLSESDWELQKRAYLAMLDNRTAFPLDGSVAVSFVQYAATATGGQASKVTLPLTKLTSEGSLGKVTSAVATAARLQPEKPGVDGLTAAASELSERGSKGSPAYVCTSATAPWDPQTLTSGVAAVRNAGATRLNVLALSTPTLTPYVAAQAFGEATIGDGTILSARNVPQFGGLLSNSCLLSALRLEGIEVNQVIQDWNNTIPLAEYKDTIVRVFVETLLMTAGDEVGGLLHGTRDGTPLPGSPLSAFNYNGDAPADGDVANSTDRANLDLSINFRLPTSWLSGDVTLTYEAPASIDCSGAASLARDCAVDVTFTPSADVPVDFVSVPYEIAGITLEPTDAALVEQMYRTEDIFPVQHVDFDFDWIPWLITAGKPSAQGVLSLMEIYTILEEGCALGDCDRYFYGVVSGAGGGLANAVGGTAAMGFLNTSSPTSATEYARNRGPHEIAHMLGAHHVVNKAENGTKRVSGTRFKKGWCGEIAEMDAPDFPYWTTFGTQEQPTLGPMGIDNSEIWGITPRLLTNWSLNIVSPYQVSPLMSYCGAQDSSSHWRWPSKQTYDVLTDSLMDPDYSGPGRTRAARTADYILIRGQLNASSSRGVRFLPIASGTFEPVAASGSGSWSIRLLDRAGKLLATRAFDMRESHGDAARPDGEEPSEVLSFTVPFPSALAPRIGRVQLLEGQRVVATQRATSAAPQVTISSPKLGAQLNGDTVTITWSATDTDSRQLTSSVFYRTDATSHWSPVAVDVPAMSVTVPRKALEASTTGEFMVVATDGLRFTGATTGPVTVANNVPLLELPSADGVLGADQNLILEALAWDAEDGVLDQQITWTSSLDGRLGTGRVLDLRASDLTEGVHTITVVATDSGKLSVAKAYTITVTRVFEDIKGPQAAGGRSLR